MLAGKTIIDIAHATDGVCALASDSSIGCWGENGQGIFGNGTAVAARPRSTSAARPGSTTSASTRRKRTGGVTGGSVDSTTSASTHQRPMRLATKSAERTWRCARGWSRTSILRIGTATLYATPALDGQ